MGVLCQYCSKVYSSQSNLNRHLIETHNNARSNVGYDRAIYRFKCLEEECNNSFKLSHGLRDHLKTVHKFNMHEEVKDFDDFEEFQHWLNNIPNEEFVQPYGRRKSKDCEAEITYFNCNRSGKPRKIQRCPKRIGKSQGSNKTDYACTAQIKVIVRSKKCTAFYYKNHYGHEKELQHLHIPKNDRAIVAGKLTIGVPISKILDSYRENFNEETLKRGDLLTRKDIHNIKSSYNIQILEGVRHSEDAVSVDLFVQECQQLENNPILLYKAQGEDHKVLRKDDFLIILMNTSQAEMLIRFGHNIIAIDSTHGLNSYDFELSTLLVVDDWGEGFPGACLLTNRQDSAVFQIFFESIKSKIGVLNPQTFMSDITNVFYNAWFDVMGAVPNQIFCAWHVDRAWQTNLNKITDSEKRKIVYQSLKVLQTTIDIREFHEFLSSFINELVGDKATENFGFYFKTNYSINFKKWAYCYRKNLGINTNMRLETMHKTIKYLYLDAKKVKRLDKGLHALNKFIRDKISDRIIKHVKGKNTYHTREINSRHKIAVCNTFQIRVCDEYVWQVFSSDQTNCYVVTKILDIVCCHLLCQMCNICIHCYSCTCVDFFIHTTICKHIHYVMLSKKNMREIYPNLTSNCDFIQESKPEIDTHLKCLSQGNKQNKEELIKNVISETNKIQLNVGEIGDIETLNHVVHTLRKENLLIKNSWKNVNPFKSNIDTSKEPSNKNIVKQLTFQSTRKKRKPANKLLQKPTTAEASEIIKTFNNQTLFISDTPKNDHNYF